jgi:hypothetical protein
MKTAKWSRIILLVACQLKRIAGDIIRLVFWKSRMGATIGDVGGARNIRYNPR